MGILGVSAAAQMGGWGVRGTSLGKIEVTKTEAHRSVLALWSFSLLCSRRTPHPVIVV